MDLRAGHVIRVECEAEFESAKETFHNSERKKALHVVTYQLIGKEQNGREIKLAVAGVEQVLERWA
jgi:hypothetical protein